MYRKKTMMNLKKMLLGAMVATMLAGCSATNSTSTQPSTKEDVQKKTDTSLEKTTTESADKEKKEDVAEKKDEKTEDKSEEKSEEKKEENAQDQQKKVLIGEWKLNSVKVNDKTYTLEELKTILQEEAYKKNLLGFTFTEKEVSMTVDGADKGTTGYHYNEKDDTWEDETARLKFKVEGETLSLVEGNTTYLFAK
mgnify:FL=1